jgi:hypothetical protein
MSPAAQRSEFALNYIVEYVALNYIVEYVALNYIVEYVDTTGGDALCRRKRRRRQEQGAGFLR